MGEDVELEQLVTRSEIDSEDQKAPTKSHQKKPLHCPYLGLFLAVLSSLFFSLCSVIVKWMRGIDPTAMAAYRFVGVLLPAIPIVIYKGDAVWPRGKRLMLLLRSITGCAALVLSFYAFRHMPLADASAIVFSAPVFTAIFARMFLKEPCGLFNVFTVATTLLGVVLITRPPLLFGAAGVESLGSYEQSSGAWSAVAALASTLFGANAYVLLRALKGVHFSIIMTNFGACAFALCTVIAWSMGGLCLPKCGQDRWLVLGLAAFSFMGQILLTVALQIEQAGPVAVARSTDIVFAFLWQVLFFQEVPNAFSIAGAVLVLSSVLSIGVRKWLVALRADKKALCD